MRTRWFNTRLLAAALLLPLAVAACGEDSTGPEEHGDEVEGVQLVLNGQTIASYDGDTGAWTGEMAVAVGLETAHIDVRFVGHDGVAITLDEPVTVEAGETLSLEIAFR